MIFWKFISKKKWPLLPIMGLLVYHCAAQKDELIIHAKQPNVIIFLADDLGYGDLSCYGQKKYETPHIDALAAQGVSCSNFYVPTPYCAPSRATLLTGRFPLRHQLILNPTPGGKNDDIGLKDDEITLGEVFKDAGYSTKAIGKWHLGHQDKFFPEHQGFEDYYGILYSNDMRPVQIIRNRDTVEYPVDQNLLTKKYTKEAIEFISRPRSNPFFLYLGYAAPHKPLAASADFYTPESPDDLYADTVRELDWSVGEITNALKRLNVLDDTIVIFMSDNGPWYGGDTGGLKGMKATTWEGGIRVPFIVRYPKVLPNNKTIEVPCWSPDIFPTLLALSNINASGHNILDGEDITNVLQGKQQAHAPIFSLRNASVMSVRKGDFKLFLKKPNYKNRDKDWLDKNAPDGKTIIARPHQPGVSQYPGLLPQEPKQHYQLFNLRQDPTESHNLAAKKPNKVNELIKDYKTFITDINLKKDE